MTYGHLQRASASVNPSSISQDEDRSLDNSEDCSVGRQGNGSHSKASQLVRHPSHIERLRAGKAAHKAAMFVECLCAYL